MSRSRSRATRSLNLRAVADSYHGWYGEQAWAPEGRKFIKRRMNRLERQYGKRQILANCS